MSTIRAKQQLCLNIASIRCFSSYSTGRYCLRFSFHQTHESNSSITPQSHNYAIPPSHSGTSGPAIDSGEHQYTTSPFLLKPNTTTPINQLCIFKHDFNIFNHRYRNDYHEILMKCTCQIIGLDYMGAEGKVLGLSELILRGVGVGDGVVIDFGDGVPCQLLGTVHNCVYQFQYLWVGNGRISNTGIMKDSISLQDNEVGKNISEYAQEKQVSISFQKYCALQSKQYVEQLLKYLLGQVQKSNESITKTLQKMEQISGIQIHTSQHHRHHEQQLPLPPLEQHKPQYIPSTSEILEIVLDEDSIDQPDYGQMEKSRLHVQNTESIYYHPTNNLHKDGLQIRLDGEDQEDEIVLDEDEDQLEEQEPQHRHHRHHDDLRGQNEYPQKFPMEIHLVQIEQRYSYNYKAAQKQRIFDNSKGIHKLKAHGDGNQDQEDERAKKRRKIFVHSQHNLSDGIIGGDGKLPKPLSLRTVSLDTENYCYQQNVQQARYIPTNPPNTHPNHPKQWSWGVGSGLVFPLRTSSVTIQEFEVMLHSQCLKIYEKWRKFISYLTQPEGMMLVDLYKVDYRKKLESLIGESIIRFKGSFDVDIYSKQENQRNTMALQIRRQAVENQHNIHMNQFKFYSSSLFSPTKPILFQQKFQRIKNTSIRQPVHHKKSFLSVSLSQNPTNSASQHLIILVHGLGACRLDMEKLRAEMRRNFKSKAHVYISCSNQGRTEGDINLMGVRLANEVEQEIAKNGGIASGLKVSFVGHSMGGIIIRSALPRLEKYKEMFHSFVSLSSPHIGYCISSSKLIDVGLWLINNWKKCESILQLTMSDTDSNKSPEESFLYKLSLQKGLEWFKKLSFLASRQDLYVPYFSARVQKPEQLRTESRINKYTLLHSKMVDNMLGRVTGTVTRIDVNFCITEQNIDNMIGRAAHICFVGSFEFLRLLTLVDEDIFV